MLCFEVAVMSPQRQRAKLVEQQARLQQNIESRDTQRQENKLKRALAKVRSGAARRSRHAQRPASRCPALHPGELNSLMVAA